MQPTQWTKRLSVVVGTLVLAGFAGAGPALAKPKKEKPRADFEMVVSAGAARCVPDATANVRVASLGPVERMDVNVSGLPPNTEFDFFVLQLPTAPFGLAWYQGDIETDENGEGHQTFRGRFNVETFIVAQPPGNQPAPLVHDQSPFPDATENPATEPIHTFHLGLWFGSPEAAAAAGCTNTVTRFNGEHNAGIQVLNTNNFPALEGPLKQLTP
jgi:hypothetical protein